MTTAAANWTARAAVLRSVALELKRGRARTASGADVHDVATIAHLATEAAGVADALAALDAVPDDDWRPPWVEKIERELAIYQSEGLAGWRRATGRRP